MLRNRSALRHRPLTGISWISAVALLFAACDGQNATPASISVFGPWCSQQPPAFKDFPLPEETEPAIAAFVDDVRSATLTEVPDDAPELITEAGGFEASIAASTASLDVAEAAASSGDFETAIDALGAHVNDNGQIAAAVAIAGGTCAEFGPASLERISRTIPILGAWQLGTGFDSLWVSREYPDTVERLDPVTGEIVASIEVDSQPFKLQEADGRMWVRTANAFVAIDPSTNTITDTLAKSDVGPDANRSWATDGGLWICDGTRVHRYDPTSVELVATADLDFECGNVYATADLVVAYTFNQDDGESRSSAAALIDPTTNSVQHTVELPIDVLVPAVSADAVYFPGLLNARAVVIDRQSGDVTEAPPLGHVVFGAQVAQHGSSIYVPVKSEQGILAVDASTFEVTDFFHVLGVNSLIAIDDTLWVADNNSGFVQTIGI
jgi:hypothetical protein